MSSLCGLPVLFAQGSQMQGFHVLLTAQAARPIHVAC